MGSNIRAKRAGGSPSAAVGVFTVAELLERPELEGAAILAARGAAAGRAIQGASVQEAPVEDFIRQDELVMTTALGLDRASDFVRFVEEVGRSGASALAVARPEQAHLTIPTAALRAAERIALPLIELPWKLRFSEVTELILRRVLERQTGRLRASQQTLALFTKVILEGGSIASIASSLEERIGRRVRVVDRWGAELHGPEAASRKWSDTPIVAGPRRLGMLSVETGAPAELEAELIEHATTALALLLLIDWADAQGEARARAELMASLQSGWTGQPKELAARVKAVGLDPDGHFVALSLRCVPIDAAEAFAESARIATEHVLVARRIAALQSWHADEGTIVLSVKATSTLRPFLADLVHEIEVSLRTRSRGVTIVCGIGQPCDVGGIPRSLKEARAAARLARVVPDARGILYYEDLGVTAALHEVMDGTAGALDELRERCLGPVLAYERTRGLPLTATLQALFAESGNVSSTARRLRINRQSLLYRLDKLRKLTGLDLARPTDRLALELALSSWQVKADSLSVTTTDAGR